MKTAVMNVEEYESVFLDVEEMIKITEEEQEEEQEEQEEA